MPPTLPLSPLRVALPAVVVANVLFNAAAARIGLGESVQVVSRRHDHLFMPAPYAFSIWGLIYAAFLAYSVVQLRAVHRGNVVYERLSAMLILTNVLAAAWVAAFRVGWIDVSVGIIAPSLALGVAMFVTAHHARTTHGLSTWITAPFPLYLGWISVATLANVSTLLASRGVNGGAYGPTPFAVALLAGAVILAVALAVGFRDYLVPAVVSWASFAILVEHHLTSPSVAAAALVAALVTALCAMLVILWNLNHFGRWQTRRDLRLARAELEPERAPLRDSHDPPPRRGAPRDSFAG